MVDGLESVSEGNEKRGIKRRLDKDYEARSKEEASIHHIELMDKLACVSSRRQLACRKDEEEYDKHWAFYDKQNDEFNKLMQEMHKLQTVIIEDLLEKVKKL